MGSISPHITPLVINSLGCGYTQTHTHTDVHTETILATRRALAGWHMPGLKISDVIHV